MTIFKTKGDTRGEKDIPGGHGHVTPNLKPELGLHFDIALIFY